MQQRVREAVGKVLVGLVGGKTLKWQDRDRINGPDLCKFDRSRILDYAHFFAAEHTHYHNNRDDRDHGHESGERATPTRRHPDAIVGDVECPGKDEGNGQADRENRHERLHDPVGRVEVLEHEIEELQRDPGDHDVSDRDTIDLALFQFLKKTWLFLSHSIPCSETGTRIAGCIDRNLDCPVGDGPASATYRPRRIPARRALTRFLSPTAC